ncbi:hypothetical protein [uncultured Desulfobacter sp.]|uniref:oxidoreductase n=1 Tax=uncultured Desulfobacter sp. TaxID=240139 RepID=UPI0029F514F9|nr:hypothetical protein [uncultured Desulfobacter sp.]
MKILSGTGYLISEFLSPLTNQRTDEYGGSRENRMRFGLEVAQAVRDAVGDDYPLIVRMIDQKFCDMVAMGRSMIADPDLPKKTREGREKEIVHCIACAQGCLDNLFKLKHVECLCNPLAQIAKKLGIDHRVAGDALKIGTAFDAVHGGYEAAVSI